MLHIQNNQKKFKKCIDKSFIHKYNKTIKRGDAPMKTGQAVRVIADKSGHQFAIGEIVHRMAAIEDARYGIGFMNAFGQLRYMTDDEYELVVSLDDDA